MRERRLQCACTHNGPLTSTAGGGTVWPPSGACSTAHCSASMCMLWAFHSSPLSHTCTSPGDEPQTAEEYLRRVRAEAAKCPQIVRVEFDPEKANKKQSQQQSQQQQQQQQQPETIPEGSAASACTSAGSGVCVCVYVCVSVCVTVCVCVRARARAGAIV